MSDDKALETQVWVKSGDVNIEYDVYAQALTNVRDDLPQASLPWYEITSHKAVKREGVNGRLYTVLVHYRALKNGEPTVTVAELIEGMQEPAPFNPADHNGEP